VGLLLSAASRVYAHAPGIDKELPALSDYLRLGVEHILSGFDHLLFLLGLIMLPGSLRALLWAVSAFTLAHSLSLALAIFGVVAPPSLWVETAIALSIAYVGAENLLRRDASARWRITLLFGFVHGFGFAGALREIGVPQDRAPVALALFNLGVEFGQLAVLALLVPGLAWLRRRPRAWSLSARLLNGSLVVVGLAWGASRAFSPAARLALQPLTPSAPLAREHSSLASVYPHDPPRSAAAAQLCEAFQRVPRVRRAECAGTSSGVTLERECTRVLSAALASGALSFDARAADSCIAQQRARYDGCEFTAVSALAPLATCSGLWRGELAPGERCRSALECRAGLTCNGVGPLDPGVCAQPKAAGESCGRALDALAAYLPHRESEHAECAGTCLNGRCRKLAR
jgi:hydrogenase/urease accessory protein HupE